MLTYEPVGRGRSRVALIVARVAKRGHWTLVAPASGVVRLAGARVRQIRRV